LLLRCVELDFRRRVAAIGLNPGLGDNQGRQRSCRPFSSSSTPDGAAAVIRPLQSRASTVRVDYAPPFSQAVRSRTPWREASRPRPNRELHRQQPAAPLPFVGSNLRAPRPPPALTSTSIMYSGGEYRDGYHDYDRKTLADSLNTCIPVNLPRGCGVKATENGTSIR